MDHHDSVDGFGVILAHTFRQKDLTEMRFSAEERACEEIERLHKKRKEFQSTSRMTAAWQKQQVCETYDPIEKNLLEREEQEEFWKNPADKYQISTNKATPEVTQRMWMRSGELHTFFMKSMKFRYAAEMEEDMGVRDERRETSSAGATRPLSLKTVISMSRSSTKSKRASA